ncbi:MAG TPA: C25 family cysteine peptidase, partial [Flavobacteriales bacterium]|nr:C25 family cysteine peptidase [Flavobacteriales bacterium]
MKRLVPLVIVLCNTAAALAQYGNEWIDHTRRYWKFEVVADGAYRIDSAALANSGFPISQVDPRELMLFGHEAQVPIYVHGETDGEFNNGDYIEFVAFKADGQVDTRLYPYPAANPNPYYSMFSDTVRYYLTWDANASAQHIVDRANGDFNAHVPRDWFWTSGVRTLNDFYWEGLVNIHLQNQGVTATDAMLSEAESFGGIPLLVNADNSPLPTQQVTVNTPGAYMGTGAPDALVMAGCGAQTAPGGGAIIDHHLRLEYGPGWSNVALDSIFAGSHTVKKSFFMPASNLGPTFTLQYHVLHDLMGPLQIGQNDPGYFDLQVPTYVKVNYARTGAIDGTQLVAGDVPYDGGDPLARFDITGFTGTPIVHAWGDSLRRITPALNGAMWPVLFPQHSGTAGTHVHVFAQETVRQVNALRAVNGDGYFTDFGALDVDSAMLIVAHRKLWNGAQAYANYRQNESTNHFNTLLADVDELYDQFGGGVPMHSGSIRMFCKYLLDTWSTDPRALFLIGKSVNTWQLPLSGEPSVRPPTGNALAMNLVPTYGNPSSDQCFTTGLNFDGRRMDIPVGRISALHNDQVIAYLNKVRETEAQDPGLWQKNILHFAGGYDAGLQHQLQGYLNYFGNIADSTYLGANVTLFSRNSSNVIAQAAADSVRHFLEDEGVSLMTFFAHAYSSSFDITIDEPENYDWHGKHPMVIGNSCYIGNFHNDNTASTSEDWVLQPNYGPIAFMAATQSGFTGYLFNYTTEWYRSFSQVNYGKTIGDHMKHAGLQSQVVWPTFEVMWSAQTMALQGDPTLTLGVHTKPDYTVDPAEIIFDPPTITADIDTFTVKVVIENQGMAVNETFNLELKRTNPGLGPNPVSHFTTLSNVYFRDTAYFRIPTRGFTGGAGLNQIEIRVDLEPDQISELEDVTNNVASTTLFITSGDLVPCYPYNYAIVPNATVELKASTGDPLAPVRNYLFQIDTTDAFNSPIMEQTSISAPGGVVTWQPSSIFNINNNQDSTVFFWRCSIDSSGNGNFNWYERSFQYITGKRGWGQAHIYQFEGDHYSGIHYDKPGREWDFDNSLRNIRADVTGNVGGPGTQWFIELEAQDYGGCGGPSWFVCAVDPVTFQAWETYGHDNGGNALNEDHQFGNGNNGDACRVRPEAMFQFAMNSPAEMSGLMDQMLAAVPNGYHLLFYTWLYLDKQALNNSAPGFAQTLINLGGPDLATLQDSVPYIFYVRKGAPSTFADTIGTSITDTLHFSAWIPTALEQGSMVGVDAGPAMSWDALYWNEKSAIGDSTAILVKGRLLGVGDVNSLVDVTSTQDSIPSPDFGSFVNSTLYPVLQLSAITKDTSVLDLRPVQMERWQLLGNPAPECAIHPPLAYYNGLNGWSEAQDAAVAVAVQNISEFPMDTLLIEATIVTATNNRVRIHYKYTQALAPGAWVVDTIRFNTLGFGGWNTLVIEANPIDTTTGRYDQLEQYHFNNIAQWRFEVDQDVLNPILDVTFDGMHVLDGDIVSAKPEILMTLDDENLIRLMDQPGDTANFKVFLHRPGSTTGEQVHFRNGQDEIMQFVPANGPDNIASIHYRPAFTADGKYTLIVQGSDEARNVSGAND